MYLIQLLNQLSNINDIVAYGRIKRPKELDKNIQYIYSPSDEIVQNLFKNSLAIISVSFYEGFGLPLLEGVSLGAIAFSTNNRGCEDFLEFGENAIELTGNNLTYDSNQIKAILNNEFILTKLRFNMYNSLKHFYLDNSKTKLIYISWARNRILPRKCPAVLKRKSTCKICFALQYYLLCAILP